jgi:hypothetical protein
VERPLGAKCCPGAQMSSHSLAPGEKTPQDPECTWGCSRSMRRNPRPTALIHSVPAAQLPTGEGWDSLAPEGGSRASPRGCWTTW